jgi:endonuclease-8
MFGSYLINERKRLSPHLSLYFAKKQELNFYACSAKIIEPELYDVYDWGCDVLSDLWGAAEARKNCVPTSEN